ncbi:MAG: adenylosuccinate synthase [Armatimonadota bacterium]
MPSIVVVGMQWGDEAKGKVVDYVSQNADIVVRYNGGNNAGHTVVIDGEIFKFHTLPVGALNKGVTSIIADGVVIDPSVLVEELDSLTARGYNGKSLKISGNAHVIMPYHKLFDHLEEGKKGDRKIGTTGRGIGPCYADKISRIGIRISELIDPEQFRKKLSQVLRVKNEILTKVYEHEPLSEDDIFAEYSAYAERIAPFVADTTHMLHREAKAGKRIVFEGAHGTLLDIDHGTYPYVTSSHTIAGGACIGTGVGPTMIGKVIGVAKSYTTRVGEGWFPTELENETGNYLRERGKEYGTTTGRPRRCGWFDAVAVRLSSLVSAVDGIALISMDVLSGLDKICVCTAYDLNGERVADFPTDPVKLGQCKPVYEELPGWKEDISGARSYEDLPVNAQNYIKRISEAVGVPVVLVSVGRGREQTILLKPEMLKL